MDTSPSTILNIKPSNDIAVIYNDGAQIQRISYSDFVTKSNDLKEELQAVMYDGKESAAKLHVGISSYVTLDLPVVVYTVMQIGHVFVPISIPDTPTDRWKFYTGNSLRWILLPKHELDMLCASTRRKYFAQAHPLRCLANYVAIKLFTSMTSATWSLSEEIIYVVQSSGTTGEPKMISVTMDCILPNVYDLRRIFGLKKRDVVLLSSSITFDASILQLFLSWSAHASILITPRDLVYDPIKFIRVLKTITVLQCTPSLLHTVGLKMLKESIFLEDTRLRVLALGGERFIDKNKFVDLIRRAKHVECFNIYGTSEVSAWASVYRLPEDGDYTEQRATGIQSDWLPIGEPLSKTSVEVRNEVNAVVKSGYGEVFIGGDERFCYLSNKAVETPQRLLATGDNAYVSKTGEIFICERKSDVIKRNGQLVSMVALTNTGNSIDCIDTCVCVFEKGTLYVFVQVAVHFRENDHSKVERTLIEEIYSKLSRSYIPNEIVFVKNLPVTSHGKVDKKELIRQSNERPVVPCNLKKYLRECWEMALNITVSSDTMESTFSECGGDSFAAVFFLNRLFRCLSCDVENVYEHLFSCVLTSSLLEVGGIVASLQSKKSRSLDVDIHNNYDVIEGKAVRNDDVTCYQRKQSTFDCNHYAAYQKQNNFSTCQCGFDSGLYRCSKSNIYEIPISGKQNRLKLRENWKYNTEKCVDASPLVVFSADFPNGIVYIGSHSMIFTAISLADGKKIWDTVVHDRIESTAVLSEDGNSVLFGCYSGFLYSLGSRTGEVQWTFRARDVIKSSPAVFQDLVIVGCHDKHVYAFNSTTKMLQWKYFSEGSCSCTPVVHHTNNCVYVCLLSGELISLAVTRGDLFWKFKVGKPIFTSPCLFGDVIVFCCVDEAVYGVDFNGNLKWNFKAGASIFSSPVCVTRGVDLACLVVFGCNDRYLYCLDKQGSLVWKHKSDEKIVSSIAVFRNVHCQSLLPAAGEKRKLDDSRKQRMRSSGVIVCTDVGGRVGILNVDNGELLTTYKCDGEIFSSAVVVDDYVMFGCRDDNVYCLQLQVIVD